MPARIQRKREKGWRLPEGAICVTRPGRWGNPFVIGKPAPRPALSPGPDVIVRDAAHAVRLYRAWINTQGRSNGMIPILGGHDLACWCPLGTPCHGDVLLELANPPWMRP